MTGRIITLITGILLLMVLAVWTNEIALIGIIGILINLLLFGFVCLIVMGRRLKFDIRVDSSTVTGKQILVRLHVNNPSIIPIFNGEIKINAKNINFNVTESCRHSFSVSGRCERDLDYYVYCDYCGKFDVDVEFVRVFDFWGIFRKTCVRNSHFTAYMFPKYYYVNSVSQIMRTNYEKERYFSHVKNTNLSEILQYREYQKGDSVKHINWKLSNRLGEYIVREFDTPTDNQILIIFDSYGDNKRSKNLIYTTLASISMTYAKNSIGHQMAWYNKTNDDLELYDITDYNSVISCIRSALNDVLTGANNTILYLKSRDMIKKYAKIIYITNRLPEYLEKELVVYENINLILADVDSTDAGSEENFVRGLAV